MDTVRKRKAVALINCDGRDEMIVEQESIRSFAVEHDLTVINYLAVVDSLDCGLREAMKRARAHRATHVIINSVATLSIVMDDIATMIDELVAHDIVLACATRRAILDVPALLVLRDLIDASSHASFRVRSSRIKNALKNNKSRAGKKFGKTDDEQRIVKQILELHHDGESLQKICEVLALSDIKTVQQRRWHPTTVKRIIDRARKAAK